MKRTVKKTKLRAAVLIALCVFGASTTVSLAYFSDYDRAAGSVGISLNWSTDIKEEVKDNNKHIAIENTGTTDVTVRVRVFGGDQLTVSDQNAAKHWLEKDDGWWYYNSILSPGSTTTELFAEIKAEDADQDDFDIIVVHESARTVYRNNQTLTAPEGWVYVPEL